MIEMRVLVPDDWPLWRRVRLAALAEAPHAFGSTLSDWQGEGDREERWRGRLEMSGRHLVALLDGDPAGMSSGIPAGQHAAELISMWVSPAARGRGVGDALIEAVEAWARQAGAQTLRLAVMDGNEKASALYERNGFHPTGELGSLTQDGARREIIMAKDLSGPPR